MHRPNFAHAGHSPLSAGLVRLAYLVAGLAALTWTTPRAAAQGPIVILVNNAIPDDGLDDTAAIAAAIDLASPPQSPESSTKIITLQPGRYDVSYSGLPFHLNGLKHVHFAGNGAELMVHGFRPDIAFSGKILFALANTTDIVFANMSVDMDRLPYSRGTVVAHTLNANGNSIDVEFEPTVTDLGAQTLLSRIDTYDDVLEPSGTVTLLSAKQFGGGDPGDYTVSVLQATPPIRLRLTAIPNAPAFAVGLNNMFGAIQPPQGVLVGHQKYGGSVIQADHCDGLNVNNMTAYAAPGMFLYALHSRDIAVDGLQLRARPGRLMSISADGLHLHNCTGSFSFTNSYCEKMGDDAVNVHGKWLEVTGVLSATRFQVNYPGANGWGAELDPGNIVEFWTADLRKRVSLSVVSFTPPSGPSNNTTPGELKTSKQPLGSMGPIQVGDVLESAAQSSPSSTTIDHVDVYANLGRAFLLQARNPIVVRTCNLVRTTGPAIRVTTDNFDFHESMGPNDVLIDDCVIERSNWAALAQQDPAAICINAFYGTSYPPSYPAAGVVRNVTISNCTIRDVPYAALHCTSATNVAFDTNILDHVATDLSLPDSTFVRIRNTDTILVANNTSTLLMPPGFPRVLQLAGSQNVTISGNGW